MPKYVIAHASATSRVLRLDLGGVEVDLYQDNPRHREIVANIYRPFDGRTLLGAHELRLMVLEAEFEFGEPDETPELLCAWPEDCGGWIDPGPKLIDRASTAIFRKRIAQKHGRRPSVMKIREGEICARCGCPLTSSDDGHHIEPRAMGGDDSPENRDPLCKTCHRDGHAESGEIRIRDGRYTVEVVAVDERDMVADGVYVRINMVGGPVSGRQYWAVWPYDMGWGPHPGAKYSALLCKDGRNLVARHVEPSDASWRPTTQTWDPETIRARLR